MKSMADPTITRMTLLWSSLIGRWGVAWLGMVLVSCPTRWSLYWPLALCIDHQPPINRETGYSNVPPASKTHLMAPVPANTLTFRVCDGPMMCSYILDPAMMCSRTTILDLAVFRHTPHYTWCLCSHTLCYAHIPLSQWTTYIASLNIATYYPATICCYIELLHWATTLSCYIELLHYAATFSCYIGLLYCAAAYYTPTLSCHFELLQYAATYYSATLSNYIELLH